MDTVKRIDQLVEKMIDHPLSVILPMIYPIALECKDYEGYCILSLWGNPVAENKASNNAVFEEIHRSLVQEGLSQENAASIFSAAFSVFLSQRTVEKGKFMGSSVKEIETQIATCNELIQTVTIPSGLHPVDLYTRSQTAEKQKIVIIENRKICESQYAKLQSYISSKLAFYRRKVSSKERVSMMEKSVRNSKDIFIIHGHNEAKLLELEKLLKDEFGLNPVILKDKPNQGLTIIDKFEKHALQCSYAIALFTPDDIVTTSDGKQYFQARPNVIFELGWFYANLGRARVCILEQASEKSKIFSDLQGIMRVQFRNNVEEALLQLRRELESAGIL